MRKNLFSLPRGGCGEIRQVRTSGAMRRRLMDLGFVEGAKVKKLLSGRGIDAYLIRGTLIALRRDDAMEILIA